ncbi:cohesin domain-containing protein [Halobacterium jilantaiense]|uniref:Cohesin domain-containing protein n=1 Tax=Halobacterium jilantaiense TaxID=355548 RepID=A0A1I0MJ74_9EURY|nr:cohesin domain-containing protein [Halobacterium jilantaiense]SEV87850.1 Cohesin domain-containing protein [Halobacterium jilantaiense]
MIDTTHRSIAVAALVVAVAVTTAAAPVVAATAGTDGRTLDSQDQPRMQLGSATVDPGETTTVELATDATGVAGYQANVTFDPAVVSVESVAGSDSFGDPVVNVNNDEGWVFVTQSQVDGTDEPVLATITFAAVGDDGARSSLGFVDEETVLNDADSTTVEVSLSPGEVTVAAGDVSSDASGSDSSNEDSQNDVDKQKSDASDGGGGGGPLGGVDPVVVGGGAAALGGTAAAGVYLGQRLG